MRDVEIDAWVRLLTENQRLTKLVVYGYGFDGEAFRNAAEQNYALLDLKLSGLRNSTEVTQRNDALKWRNVHRVVLNICIAMAPLQIPNYVLLHIIDQLPKYCFASHGRKIRLIESVSRSYRKIKNLEEQ